MDYSGAIRMSPDEMEAQATGFENDRTTFLDVVSSMRNRVNALADTWEGQAKEAFVTEFSDLEPGFEATAELISDIAQQLRSISSIMLENQSQIASQLGVK